MTDYRDVRERLSEKTLRRLAGGVRAPGYDRSVVAEGIVHLGIGAFHRAHQAVLTDDCLERGETDWGIVGASLRSPDTRDALAPQDGLYTVDVRSSESRALRVIGAVKRLLVASEDPSALIGVMADPRVRIVSLTVTEKGYLADPATGGLRADDPDVLHDLAHPRRPRSALGFLAAATARRRSAGVSPFTVLSCDNLPGNGRRLKAVLTAFAARLDRDLARYVADAVPCPATMVDRIVPTTLDGDRLDIAGRLALRDAWPVVTEPFYQWVIEDRFPLGRPGWEASGVAFVADVEPYEHMKLRLLNGAHTTIAAIGRIAGFATVDAAMARTEIRRFVESYWQEVFPTLPSELQPATYTRRLLDRFGNVALAHRTEQIATDGSQKLPQRILAPYRDLRARGRPTCHIVHAIAAWIHSCAGVDERGRAFTVTDPGYQAWTGRPDQRHASAANCVRAFLDWPAVFGTDLRGDGDLVDSLTRILDDLRRRGVLQVLDDLHHRQS